jgi:hypothetical protein
MFNPGRALPFFHIILSCPILIPMPHATTKFKNHNSFQIIISGTADSNLVIQVRTTRVDDVNATGFTALAVKEGDAETIQVNLLSTGNKLRK